MYICSVGCGVWLPCWRTWSLSSLSLEKALPQCSHTSDSGGTKTGSFSREQHHASEPRPCRRSVLTDGLGLSVQVVKQLRVAGEHATTRGTGDQSFLGVAPHVLAETIADLEEGVTACDGDESVTETQTGHVTGVGTRGPSVVPVQRQKRACCWCERHWCSALST